MDLDEATLYFTRPYFGARFHIFKNKFALCGKARMITVDPENCEPVTGKESYKRNQDCKTCFRKAGLKL